MAGPTEDRHHFVISKYSYGLNSPEYHLIHAACDTRQGVTAVDGPVMLKLRLFQRFGG